MSEYMLSPILVQLAELHLQGQIEKLSETADVTFFTNSNSQIAGICACFASRRFEYNFPPRGKLANLGPTIGFTFNFFRSRSRNKSPQDRENDVIIPGWEGLSRSERTEFISVIYKFLQINKITEVEFSEYREYLTSKHSQS